MKTGVIAVRRPRNRLVVLAQFRRAGAHGGGIKTARQDAARELRRQLLALKEGP